MKTLVAVLAVLGALALGAKADVQIGNLSVSDAAAAFGEVSELVCGVFEAMEFEPVDWSEVASAYETEGSTIELSLQELAQGAVFGDDIPEVWADYQAFFGDDTWLDTNVRFLSFLLVFDVIFVRFWARSSLRWKHPIQRSPFSDITCPSPETVSAKRDEPKHKMDTNERPINQSIAIKRSWRELMRPTTSRTARAPSWSKRPPVTRMASRTCSH